VTGWRRKIWNARILMSSDPSASDRDPPREASGFRSAAGG
jgi:hypothetical protein